ncbi:hypothetical protein ABK040_008140 [Willaertia magna]
MFSKFLDLFQQQQNNNNKSELFEIFRGYSLEYKEILLESYRIRERIRLYSEEYYKEYTKSYNGLILLLQDKKEEEKLIKLIKILHKCCDKNIPMLIIICNDCNKTKSEENNTESYFSKIENILTKSERKYHIERKIDMENDINRIYVLLEWLFVICMTSTL